MSQQFPGQEAIETLDADIKKINTFVNTEEPYTAEDGTQVESIRMLVARILKLIQDTDTSLQELMDMSTQQIQELINTSEQKIDDLVAESVTELESAMEALRSHGRGTWAPNTDYLYNDIVENSGDYYLCVVVHTSGSSFASDLAAGKWLPYFSAVEEVTGGMPGLAPAIGSAAAGAVAFVSQENEVAEKHLAYGGHLSRRGTQVEVINGAVNASFPPLEFPFVGVGEHGTSHKISHNVFTASNTAGLTLGRNYLIDLTLLCGGEGGMDWVINNKQHRSGRSARPRRFLLDAKAGSVLTWIVGAGGAPRALGGSTLFYINGVLVASATAALDLWEGNTGLSAAANSSGSEATSGRPLPGLEWGQWGTAGAPGGPISSPANEKGGAGGPPGFVPSFLIGSGQVPSGTPPQLYTLQGGSGYTGGTGTGFGAGGASGFSVTINGSTYSIGSAGLPGVQGMVEMILIPYW